MIRHIIHQIWDHKGYEDALYGPEDCSYCQCTNHCEACGEIDVGSDEPCLFLDSVPHTEEEAKLYEVYTEAYYAWCKLESENIQRRIFNGFKEDRIRHLEWQIEEVRKQIQPLIDTTEIQIEMNAAEYAFKYYTDRK